MNNKLTNLIIFAAGAAVGSVVTWKMVKTKYEQIAREEIDSVKQVYREMYEEWSDDEDDYSEDIDDTTEYRDYEKPDLMEYAAKLKEAGYVGEKEVDNLMDDVSKPYVIEPDEFGEEDDYETVSLIYYADKVLTDENDNIIENVDDVVGIESLEHFGEYEDDSVFVRNDRLKRYYEICLDERNYCDICPE